MNSSPPNISVIVLCFQSGDKIGQFVDSLVSSLSQYEPDWELILVGNYFENSGDKTPEVVRAIAAKNTRIKAVTKIKEDMMGWDMKSGLDAATGQILAVIDGDGQMPPEDVARVYKKMKEEKLDLAKTYRAERYDSYYRTCISKVYNLLFKVLFPGLECEDINSKPKVMTRGVYGQLELKSNGWFIDAEIMIQARRLGLKVAEVPTVFHGIESRASFIKPTSILEFLANLIWYRILEFRYGFIKTGFINSEQKE